MTNRTQDLSGWIGQQVLDSSGAKVGKVAQIYYDDDTGQPEWLAVNTGLFKSKASFVPLPGTRAEDNQLVIPYDKDQVKNAPQVEEDSDDYLMPEEEEQLYRHYGLAFAGAQQAGQGPVGRDTSGPETDDAMTRSEEELRVGKTSAEKGRARLRKYVVTENVETTVPVSREEVRVEREPITEANVGQAMEGPEISEEEHEVVLHEEQPIVQKQTVPKERVRLSKDVVEDEAAVSEQVRKERIETEGDQRRS